MRYFVTGIFLVLLSITVLLLSASPALARHIDSTKRDRCGEYTVSSECLKKQETIGTMGTCSYTETTYECRDEYTLGTITCIQKSPLDCGNGVTVCGGPAVNDGYNCNNWCSDNWDNSVSKDSTKYRASPPYNCNPPFTYSDKTCYMNACLSGPNQECTNAGTLPTNACPGSPDVQCDPTHSCVFQQPVTQTTPACICPNPSTVPCGTTSTTPTNSPCTGSVNVAGTNCTASQACNTTMTCAES